VEPEPVARRVVSCDRRGERGISCGQRVCIVSTAPLPPEVRDFLDQRIETYEHLEIALLFGRQPGIARDAPAVSSQLRLPDGTVAEALERFTHAEVLQKSTARNLHEYSCAPEAAVLLAALAQAYDQDRAAVMQVMTENAMARLRTSALRAFSSAFLLGRKRDG